MKAVSLLRKRSHSPTSTRPSKSTPGSASIRARPTRPSARRSSSRTAPARSVRVLVFAAGEAERVAREAGADYAGVDDLVQQIQGGWLEFDAAVAMADQMGKVGGLGRILGRRGLMPNPRSGTVVRDAEDLPGVLSELKGGRVEFRNDRTGIVHLGIGRKSFTDDQIRDNLFAFVDALQRAKPTGAKGVYLRTLTDHEHDGPWHSARCPGDAGSGGEAAA